jgi:uncharacterized protein
MREWPPQSAEVVLSASDLTRFQACAHATALDLRFLRGEPLVPAASDESAELLQAKGNEHEAAFLAGLRSTGRTIATIEREADLDVAVARTVEALHQGPDVIYQAALRSGPWSGYADFLERVERPSRLGEFSYEVVDTKLKRSPAPSHLLQLCLYADLLGELQGLVPASVHVVLGDGKRASFATADFAAYTRRLRERLGAFVGAPSPTQPEPVTACALCRWREYCEGEWRTTDSLSQVAGIRRNQRDRLEAAGISTMAGLGASTGEIRRFDREILAGLRQQARLQTARRQGGAPAAELRPIRPGLGLARLPLPSPGDLFFDMEGDPLIEGGLEYLFGVYDEATGRPRFRTFWAHRREDERTALASVLRLFDEHLRRYPDAHIYHYNHYEVTALKRLASRDGVGEGVLDELLRQQRFVDLYRVVQQGIRTSEPGYSLKDLEIFFAGSRGDGVTTAAGSVVAYERYRQSGDAAVLEEIRAYNETDCRSTHGLRDWLTGLRPAGMPWWPRLQADDADAETSGIDRLEAERLRLRAVLAPARPRLGDGPVDLLFELAFFHQREDKPAWWAIFDRKKRESAELIDDLECVGGLIAEGMPRPVKRSRVQAYRFPPQETKLRSDATASVQAEGLSNEKRPAIDIVALDAVAGTAELRFGPSWRDIPLALDLVPGDPLRKKEQKNAIARVIADVAAGGTRYPAIVDLLTRSAPRLTGHTPGMPIIAGDAELVEATASAVSRLDGSCLPIQGPPGTGKTYVSSHVILGLLRAGKRVGVASNAHKAIDNLMIAVADRAREQGYRLNAVKRDRSDEPIDHLIAAATDNDDPMLASASLVGGTAWLFSREELDRAFDYLFVDEAGQVALANIVAIGTAARNLVLVGDPMQLGQPVQGVHPGDSGLSALEYLLAGRRTMPPDRGIFFPETRRLHPEICRFVSDLAYDARLHSIAGAERQGLVLDRADPRLAPSGIRFVEVEHEGRSQSSPEEGEIVRALWLDLLRHGFRDRDGAVRRLAPDDILVVAPYNAHVNLLQRVLPTGARVGTVDRFQGQEAPVSILSLATSSGQELPRDVDFLFSRSRLNVALSRAQALAIVVASPRLLDVACSTVEQMRLVNAFCSLREYAGGKPDL